DKIARMRAQGAQIVIAQADVSDESAMRELFEGPLRSLPALRGVVHAAGLLQDGVLAGQDWSRFSRPFSPKAGGAWLLHQFTQGCQLDFFILFSSASALLGGPGQGNY